MVGESDQNLFLIQIDASSFAEFEISEFEISRFDCNIAKNELFQVGKDRFFMAAILYSVS